MSNRTGADVVAVDIVEVLRAHNKGKTLHELSLKVNEVVTAIRETGKKSGSVTLKLDIHTIKGDTGQVFITDNITVKKPEPDRKGSIFFTTEKGGLQRNDPRQEEMVFMNDNEESEVA